MNTQLLEYTEQKVDELLAAPSSSKNTLNAAQTWKDVIAQGVDADAATKELLDALDKHHTTIDELIAFAEGPAKEVVGEEYARELLAHAHQIKDQGAKYCDCDACKASHELLAKHGRPVL